MPPDLPILDDRNPQAAARVAQAARAIRRQAALFRIKVAAMLACGGLLCLLGPALMAGLVLGIEARGGWHFGIGCWGIFAIASLLVPLLFWLEWRTRGEFFAQEMRAQGHGTGESGGGMLRTGSYGEWELKTQAASLAAWVEVLLFAPRLVLSAIRQTREHRATAGASIERAAELIDTLRGVDGGMEIAALMRPGEDASRLGPLIGFLSVRDWIGVSKDGTRVWLERHARRWIDAV